MPPPPCTATVPPTVTLTQPQDTVLVQEDNGFLLEGNVGRARPPITSASIAATSSGRPDPQRVHLSGARPPRGRRFRAGVAQRPALRPVPGVQRRARLGDQLPRHGEQRAATRVLAAAVARHPAPPARPDRGDPVGFRRRFDAVPLVAASPNGVKRTFARVYLTAEGTSQRIDEASGSLTAVRPDGSRPPGPLRAFSGPRPVKPRSPPGTLEQAAPEASSTHPPLRAAAGVAGRGPPAPRARARRHRRGRVHLPVRRLREPRAARAAAGAARPVDDPLPRHPTGAPVAGEHALQAQAQRHDPDRSSAAGDRRHRIRDQAHVPER